MSGIYENYYSAPGGPEPCFHAILQWAPSACNCEACRIILLKESLYFNKIFDFMNAPSEEEVCQIFEKEDDFLDFEKINLIANSSDSESEKKEDPNKKRKISQVEVDDFAERLEAQSGFLDYFMNEFLTEERLLQLKDAQNKKRKF